MRGLGLDPSRPQLAYLTRLLGVRDLALGAGLQLSDPRHRRLWLTAGALCDATDGTASILAARNREISRLTMSLASAPALAGVGLGLAALRAQRADPQAP